jgi:Leucine-rich repeat (LRR) protein
MSVYKIIVFTLVISLTNILVAQDNTIEKAKIFASEFLMSKKETKDNYPDISLKVVYQSPDTAQNYIYCFQENPAGFVLVAEYDGGFIITGYSPEGKFDYVSLNPGLKNLLALYEQTNSFKLNTKLEITSKGSPAIVAPLLDIEPIKWGQGFNGACPYDAEAGTHTLAGCVAVSMAQIMRYHKYPQSGTGSHSYTHSKYGTITANFENTIYKWDNMPGDETLPNSFIDTLMFHCGVGAEMNYGVSASAAYTSKAKEALNSYFKYPDAQYINSIYFAENIDFFYQFLRDEIANNRPVLYEIYGNPGHSVVCDGYDETLFHLNFGWSGSSDGYYLLEGMLGSYHMKGNAVIGISPTPIVTNMQDSLALVALYNSANGSQWVRNDGWLSQPVNKWQGVTVINGRVIKLDLSANNLSGFIPSEIGNLASLIWLNLNYNSLPGNLPEEIGLLTNLISLEISSASLTGSITPEISNLTNLQKLNLSGNQFTGNIPDVIYNLINLTSLSLYNNMLSGNISPMIGQLIKLQYFSVWKNQLTGSLPTEIGNLFNLTDFIIADNQFSGTIPETISSWTSLRDFNISDNQFEDALPEAVLGFTNLSGLIINNNKFTSIPENIGQLSQLQKIEAANNMITSIPGSVADLSALFRLDLNNNNLTSLPDFGEMPALWDLQLSNNQIEKLPESFGSLIKLSSLYVGNNNISVLPSSFEKLSRLRVLVLSGNNMISVPVNFCFLSSLEELYLMDNEINGPMPPLNFLGIREINITKNKMVFSDIASSLMPDDTVYTSDYIFDYYDQAKVTITDSLFSFAEGDSAGVDIRSISRLSHTDNIYNWYKDNELVQEGAILNFPTFTTDNEGNYYCRVRNKKYKKALELVTDSVYLKAGDKDPLEGATLVSSRESVRSEFSDNIVLLQPSPDLRGEIVWQVSTDSVNWVEVSPDMDNASIIENIISIEDNKIQLEPKTDLLFRYMHIIENCDPIISDTIRINSYADLLLDTLLNVRDKIVTIAADSIEITIPANFTDKDFRLTIKKLRHPPEAPDSKLLASVYDVNVSIGSVFDIPLLIKLKNINKDAFAPENIDRYKAAYYDEETREWATYENSALVLHDSSLVFETNHLTKLSWLWDTEVIHGYTDVFIRNNIRVYWKELDEDFLNLIYGKSQTTQPWHVTTGDPEYDTPKQIQDIAQYLYEVMEAFRSLNIPVPDHAFSVYVKEMDDYGNVGLMGLMNHYLNINRDTESPELLRSVLAHEFMHYTQNNYISAHAGNLFWLEANAHLSDRLVWDETIIPVSESEKYLLESRTGENNIYSFLATSWNHWDKGILTQNTLGNVNYCYLAGTFIHYMRSYKEGTKLDPVVLLKETPYFQGWLEYLDSYTQQHLSSNIGDQYENFVKYIVESQEPDFGLINQVIDEDPLKYLKTASSEFMTNKFYKFNDKPEKQIQKDSLRLKMPYLSSQMVQMYNLNINNQKVLIKYKRTSLQNENIKVYLGKYDKDTRKMILEDISAIDSSNFIIESPAGNNMEDKKHVAYLLLINKDKTMELNVNYDLEILSIPDFTYFDAYSFFVGLSLTDAPIHSFTDGVNETLGTFTNMPGVFRQFADEYYSPLTYNVQITDTTITTSASSDWIDQSVTYNFVTGDMVIYDRENAGGPSATATIDIREMTMVLKNVWLTPSSISSNAKFKFSTLNTVHTQEVIKSISYTRKFALYDVEEGEHYPIVTTTYLKTNYVDANGEDIDYITFNLIFY